MTSRRFNIFDESSVEAHGRGPRGLGVARERAGAGRRAGGRIGCGEREMGCGKHFLNRAAILHGKRAEKQAENRDFREESHSQKTLKISHFFPTFPPFSGALQRAHDAGDADDESR